jgi:hypothetical protein
MANVVFIQDGNGDVVDQTLYCSDTCAKSDVWYGGWWGCEENYTTPFCPNCGTAMYWTDENTNTHYLGNEEQK